MKEQQGIKCKSNLIFREEDGSGFLCNPDTGAVAVLNETAKFIWPRLHSGKGRDEIIREMIDSFEDIEEKQAENDFEKFISELGRNGLLENYVLIPPFPQNICLGIISKCNFNCKHCLNRNSPATDPDLTTEEILRLIDQLCDNGVKSLSLFGGEPLCHPDFKKIVEYLNQKNISISLNTNGTLIDEEMAHWLRGRKVNSAVVSFDGSKAEIMDAIRGKGAFEKAIKGIEALRAEGINVLLSATLNKINYKDVREMVLLGKKIKGNSVRFNHVFFSGNAACFVNEIYLSPQEEREAIEAVWSAQEEFGEFIAPKSSYLSQKEKFMKTKDYEPSFDKIIVPCCGAARTKLSIRPDGWVVPCEIIWEVKCCNVKERPLKEIWQGSEVMRSFRKPLELDLNDLPECKGCHYQYLCFLGHRCYPYYFPGGIKNRALYCWRKENLSS